MKLEEKYRKEASGLIQPLKAANFTAWRSPSNIALIKYWGKRQNQLPQNPSLSFALDESFTETRMEYRYRGDKGIRIEFTFENKTNPAFETRIKGFLKTTSEFLPFLNQFDLKIQSRNSFPHSSGIASSASSFSALALCLVAMEQKLFGTPADDKSFYEKASFLARLGSGSAARSVYGGLVVWGKHNSIRESSDEAAIKLNSPINKNFDALRDAILITSTQEKKVSSGEGHRLMVDHPYAAQRYKQARINLEKMMEALLSGDEESFIHIAENEALSLHALMLASNEGFTLLNENTWSIITRIRQFRSEKKIFITFTLDAGPNVHLIYPDRNKKQVAGFIHDELLGLCEEGRWIDDKAGSGPVIIS